MKFTIAAVKEAMGNGIHYMIGGGQMDDEVAKYVGADAFWQGRHGGGQTLRQMDSGRECVMENTGQTTKTPEQTAYEQREKRIMDAIQLKKPDRIPVTAMFSFFPARYKGIPIRKTMYDPEVMFDAWVETLTAFAPDLSENPFPMRHLGNLLETFDFKMLKWAGHGLGDDVSYQFVDEEYMKADEYDAFLYDMTDYMMHKFWPRVFGAPGALRETCRISTMSCATTSGAFYAAPLFTDEMVAMGKMLRKAAEHTNTILSYAGKFSQTMAQKGFPANYGAATQVPFDTLGGLFARHQGAYAGHAPPSGEGPGGGGQTAAHHDPPRVSGAQRTGNPRVFIPLHKGVESFMSDAQYQKFYWPGFKALLDGLIDEGLYPCPLVEGAYDARVKYLAQVPSGKVCYHFENFNAPLLKEELAHVACVRGGMPLRILSTGTPDDVKAQLDKVLAEMEDVPGFMVDASTGLDEARPECVRAMFDYMHQL